MTDEPLDPFDPKFTPEDLVILRRVEQAERIAAEIESLELARTKLRVSVLREMRRGVLDDRVLADKIMDASATIRLTERLLEMNYTILRGLV